MCAMKALDSLPPKDFGGGAADAETSVEMDLQDRVEVFRVDLVKEAVPKNPGIVDDPVEPR